MIKNAFLFFIGALSCLMITSCTTPTPIDANEWKLTSSTRTLKFSDRIKDQYSIGFSAKDSTVHGVAGCNRFFGKYEVSKNDLKISLGGTTMMACPDNASEQEFLKILDEADTYKITKGQLQLSSKGSVIATFDALTKE